MVRVIGPLHLAQEAQRALAAVGVESYFVTTSPMAAAAATGQDGSTADVFVGADFGQALGSSGEVKRRAPLRPVVVAGPAKLERALRIRTKVALGPDAFVVWPATGEALRDALERAAAGAGKARPRIAREMLPGFAVSGAGLFFLLAGAIGDLGGFLSSSAGFELLLLGMALGGVGDWLHASYLASTGLRLTGGISGALSALLLVLHLLLR